MKWTLKSLAQALEAELVGDPDCEIDRVATLHNAGSGSLSFLANSKYRKYLKSTGASAVLLTNKDAADFSGNALVVTEPYVAYARAAKLLYPAQAVTPGQHPSAVVENSAVIDETAYIGPQAYIGDGVRIAAGVYIGPGCVIGHDVQIGQHTRLVARVTLCERVAVGSRVTIHPGVVIGADGFGIALDSDHWIKVPQVGSVHIGDDVDIGANTTIDRGAIDDTIIHDGVKLDNQIQIGHNVIIGEHTVIAGCVGISGSTQIGRYCAIGGGTGIAGHIEIVDNVQLTGMSMVTKSISEAGSYSSGIPVEPTREWHKNVIRYRQMEKLFKQVKTLTEKQSD
ncbi:UDP-3-O-(3-hydroxymyristoyl) glucosamine N-acyltransferase [Methylophaga frappieri]|uniref:UDP-3-O-acylglucosamine N-acyltransferase n=1 Tax=Methylophaga frappieri (strain ATCC BAA-2434 / DSM 25690 / JAM7) TaxID=754477 RepID=I1YG41_METFJ|nr:UDP-3-O-(3-hydroxymyristoyl)glucosamine N-acyltransferase [Methylophaga frappieri]AFJ01884.1 UDP-3-O-(3-hydroxymyristoyl) glucosamine N-acyltransferase [Methylophaga frappieri]